MTITFADGTRIEVEAAAFNDFIKYDLKWVEFVHGKASEPKPLYSIKPQSDGLIEKNVHRCPSQSC